MRDVGDMGENDFQKFCSDGGLIANKAFKDKHGWDFIVGFPNHNDASTFNIHKSPFECKVQVKSTDGTDRSNQITLQNLHRLCTYPLASFIAFFEFDGTPNTQRLYVVHVDSELITKVLKRMHELEQSDNENNFNERTMVIKYDDSHQIPELSGKALSEILIKHIGTDINAYAAAKKEHLDSTGFENGVAIIQFKATDQNTKESLISASLGQYTELDISDVVGVNTRFGTNEKEPFLSIDSGKLVIGDIEPSAKGSLQFREDKISEGIHFSTQVIPSLFNAYLPDNEKVIRFNSEYFDFDFFHFSNKILITFKFNYNTKIEVKKLNELLKLGQLLQTKSKTASVKFISDEGKAYEFSLDEIGMELNFQAESRALECVNKIITEFNHTNPIHVSLNELRGNFQQILNLYACLYSKVDAVGFKMESDEETKSIPEAVYLYMTTAPIGSHIFLAIIVFIGPLNVKGVECTIKPNICRIEKKYVFRTGEDMPKGSIEDIFKNICDKYENEYEVFSPNRIG